jgi:hypothetical protein
MPVLSKRPWYLASVALVLAATALEFAAKNAANTGMVTMARGAEARHEGAAQGLVDSMHRQGFRAAHRAGALSLIGLVSAVAAGACFFVSIQTHESRWDVIPIGFGLVYIALLVLQV